MYSEYTARNYAINPSIKNMKLLFNIHLRIQGVPQRWGLKWWTDEFSEALNKLFLRNITFRGASMQCVMLFNILNLFELLFTWNEPADGQHMVRGLVVSFLVLMSTHSCTHVIYDTRPFLLNYAALWRFKKKNSLVLGCKTIKVVIWEHGRSENNPAPLKRPGIAKRTDKKR